MLIKCSAGLVARQAGTVIEQFKNQHGLAFRKITDESTLVNTLEHFCPSYRDTPFAPPVVLFAWMGQVLSSDKSCREAVSKINEDRIASGQKPVASSTASYCEARGRFPKDLVQKLSCDTALGLESETPPAWLWQSRHVKVIDGSTFTMDDTAENQAMFPQLKSQAIGAGFPIARMVAVMSLAFGTILDAAFAPFEGKLTGEHAILRSLFHCFEPGDVVLGDAYYGSFFLVAQLRKQGVDCVFGIPSARDIDFRRGKKLENGDHQVAWKKPRRPEWMTPEEYELYPDTMIVRESRFQVETPGFRTSEITVVTTLVDAKGHSKTDLATLYRRRWMVEVNIRALKTTMKMEHIRCCTPDMVAKDFWMHVLAYNLMRKLMAQAAWRHSREPWQISFKGAIQTLTAYRNLWRYSQLDPEVVMVHLLDAIQQHVVGNRPDRHEPRAQKRRPKQYPFLKGRRSEARKAM